ncbi:TPA: response regulator transcription factor [Candidatus Avigastranaerophilus faecigallinarum]|nr:response regulator transcription factor [Candidatus Avigastranaerophilus faecigallinarum]
MPFFNLSAKNIRFNVVENNSKSLEPDDCFLEITVKKTFLNDFLVNLLLLQESSPILDIPLTKREKQVLKCLSSGKNNAQIAEAMHVSVHTAKVHIHNIFSKLSVQDRTEAVVKAIKYKLIDI